MEAKSHVGQNNLEIFHRLASVCWAVRMGRVRRVEGHRLSVTQAAHFQGDLPGDSQRGVLLMWRS